MSLIKDYRFDAQLEIKGEAVRELIYSPLRIEKSSLFTISYE